MKFASRAASPFSAAGFSPRNDILALLSDWIWLDVMLQQFRQDEHPLVGDQLRVQLLLAAQRTSINGVTLISWAVGRAE